MRSHRRKSRHPIKASHGISGGSSYGTPWDPAGYYRGLGHGISRGLPVLTCSHPVSTAEFRENYLGGISRGEDTGVPTGPTMGIDVSLRCVSHGTLGYTAEYRGGPRRAFKFMKREPAAWIVIIHGTLVGRDIFRDPH